jgi:putative restriction endonuclease
LPARHSPLNGTTGNGNQKAYLAEISQELFEAVGRASLIDIAALYTMSDHPEIDASIVDKIEKEIETQIDDDPNLSKTEKLQVSRARVGQGQFRDNVSRREPKCRMTGIFNPALLTASHIKSWRLCVSSTERLDGANGLMLTAHVDQLFDRGLLSFQNNGDVMISSKLPTADLAALHLSEIHNVGPFASDQTRYLDYHRTAVFLVER